MSVDDLFWQQVAEGTAVWPAVGTPEREVREIELAARRCAGRGHAPAYNMMADGRVVAAVCACGESRFVLERPDSAEPEFDAEGWLRSECDRLLALPASLERDQRLRRIRGYLEEFELVRKILTPGPEPDRDGVVTYYETGSLFGPEEGGGNAG